MNPANRFIIFFCDQNQEIIARAVHMQFLIEIAPSFTAVYIGALVLNVSSVSIGCLIVFLQCSNVFIDFVHVCIDFRKGRIFSK